MERQRIGFDFELEVCEKFNLLKSDNYTSEWDAFSCDCLYSIKTVKNRGSICFGDIMRQYNHSNSIKDFYLVLGNYDNNNIFIYKRMFYIPIDIWHKHLLGFDTLIPDINKLKEVFFGEKSNETNDRKYDVLWRNMTKNIKSRWKEINPNSMFCINFKRDHKGQRRIQCSISYKKFEENIYLPSKNKKLGMYVIEF